MSQTPLYYVWIYYVVYRFINSASTQTPKGRNCKTYRKLALQRNVGKCIESESKNNEFTMKMIVLI